ncbi:hypothetical protein NQ318_005066 [Aromia moschata]|uniref:Uncharacterized protein n=1 Tax=Aromia moschata TaxID=1265417 RepID=A0AAV8YDG9_9CUCU|nr:hypothetical protein NQ318_005066 [Aromia moschata]
MGGNQSAWTQGGGKMLRHEASRGSRSSSSGDSGSNSSKEIRFSRGVQVREWRAHSSAVRDHDCLVKAKPGHIPQPTDPSPSQIPSSGSLRLLPTS